MSNNRSNMPSKKKIEAYWRPILAKMGHIYIDDEEYCCFACSLYDRPLHRAHILPLCKGGSNNIDNIHLLCRACHEDSEFLDGERYWNWLKSIDTNEARQRNAKRISNQVRMDLESFFKSKNIDFKTLKDGDVSDELFDELSKYMSL